MLIHVYCGMLIHVYCGMLIHVHVYCGMLIHVYCGMLIHVHVYCGMLVHVYCGMLVHVYCGMLVHVYCGMLVHVYFGMLVHVYCGMLVHVYCGIRMLITVRAYTVAYHHSKSTIIRWETFFSGWCCITHTHAYMYADHKHTSYAGCTPQLTPPSHPLTHLTGYELNFWSGVYGNIIGKTWVWSLD